MNVEDRSPPGPMEELEFSRLVEAVRPALRGYVMSLTPDRGMADEVFQDTLILLWRDRAKFERGSNFRAWAFKCGYFSALAKKRDRSREKAVCYSDEFFHHIAEHAERHAGHAEARLGALRACVGSLETEDRSLLVRRYGDDTGVRPVATEGTATNRIHKALSRLRLRLKLCVEKRLKAEA